MGIEARINRYRTLKGLDAYVLQLANRGHVWTEKQCLAFDCKVRELKRRTKESN